MVQSPAVEIGQQIDPDQVARIEIARSASSEKTQVRIFLTDAAEPHLFEFDSMRAAIEFYEQLWALRTAGNGDEAASHSA